MPSQQIVSLFKALHFKIRQLCLGSHSQLNCVISHIWTSTSGGETVAPLPKSNMAVAVLVLTQWFQYIAIIAFKE